MTSKLKTIILVAVIGLIFPAVGVLASAEKKSVKAPDEAMIENEGYKKDKKGPVKFSHKKHSAPKGPDGYGVSCSDCHHVYDGGKNVWKEADGAQKCSECHDPIKKQGKTKKLQNAYHRNCKNCHKAYVKENPDSGAPFKKCTGCHEKKS